MILRNLKIMCYSWVHLNLSLFKVFSPLCLGIPTSYIKQSFPIHSFFMFKSAVDIMEERSSITLRAGTKFWTAGNIIVKGHRFLSKDLALKCALFFLLCMVVLEILVNYVQTIGDWFFFHNDAYLYFNKLCDVSGSVIGANLARGILTSAFYQRIFGKRKRTKSHKHSLKDILKMCYSFIPT